MKKFVFKLEKLLSYKNQILESELAILADLNRQLNLVDQQISVLERKKANTREDLEERLKANATPSLCQIYQSFMGNLQEQIKLKKIERLEISSEIEDQVNLIKKLKMESKSLETLKETRFDDYKKEFRKITELQIEEFVGSARIIRQSI